MRPHSSRPKASEYLLEFGEFVSNLSPEDLPSDVQEAVIRVFVDSFGAILVGNNEPEVLRLGDALLPLSSGTEATVLRVGFPRADRKLVAFLNGTAGPSLELDEGYRLAASHAGIGTVPAALAEAEARHASGGELAVAIVAGYEAAARAARATKFTRPMQPHGIWSAIASSVAIAKLRGADSQRIATALSIGASLTFNTTRVQKFFGATVRNLWNGLGSQIGFFTNDLIDTGFIGPADGLADTFSHISGDAFDRAVFVKELGSEFAITRNYHKRYACCGHINAPIEATLSATMGRCFSPSEVEAIDVSTYPQGAELYDGAPINPMAARFSIPWCVAAVVSRGTLTVEASSVQSLSDQDIQSLAKKARVVVGADAGDAFSLSRSAQVRLRLHDGRLLEGRCDNPPGDFQSPLSDNEIDEKFRQLAGAALDSHVTTNMLQSARQLLQLSDISELTGQVAGTASVKRMQRTLPVSAGRSARSRDYLDELSEFVSHTHYDDIPHAAREQAKRVLLDELGAIICGSAEPEVCELARAFGRRSHPHTHTASVFSPDLSHTGPLEAALIIGTAASAQGMERGHHAALAQAGIPAIPAGLAWGEHLDVSGQDFLTALILGYDVSVRMASATTLDRPLHPHGIWPVLGAAVTVMKIMKGEPLEVRETISLASCLTTAAPYMTSETTLGCVYNGLSNYTGIFAALSSRAGFTSPLDGPALILGTIAGNAFRPDRVTSDLGKTYEITKHHSVQLTDEELRAKFASRTKGIIRDPGTLAKIILAADASSLREVTHQIHQQMGERAHGDPKIDRRTTA